MHSGMTQTNCLLTLTAMTHISVVEQLDGKSA